MAKIVAEKIREADAIIVTAGAGMGVDSGLPDFRSENGFWNAYPEAEELGLDFYELADPSFFKNDPELAWGFYGHRLNMYRSTEPHEGFSILKNITENIPHYVYTSNVDGHFQVAGFDNVWECHGSINFFQPVEVSYSQMFLDIHNDLIIPGDRFNVEIENMRAISELPKNEEGQLLRPNVLMFRDAGWLPDREQQQKKHFTNWFENEFPCTNKTVVLECGAGVDIQSARTMGERIVTKCDGTLIRINPNHEKVYRKQDISMKYGALEALTAIKEQLK